MSDIKTSPSATTTVPSKDAGKNNAEDIKKIKEELNQQSSYIDVRLSGAEGHIKSTEQEIKETGVFAWVSGHKKVLQEQLVKEKTYKEKIVEQKKEFEKTKKLINELINKGDIKGAKLVLEKGINAYKANISKASTQASDSYKKSNSTLQDVDTFYDHAETVCKVSKEVAKGAAVTAATIGTGGLAGVALGIAAGTTAGAVVNYGNATQEAYVFESKSASQAFSEANSATLQDAKDSTISAVGSAVGAGAAGKIVGKASSIAGKVATGIISGGTSSAVTTSIHTTEALVNANIEFNKVYGEQIKDMSSDEVTKLKQEFFASKGLTGEQIIKSSVIDVGSAMLSGGVGSTGNASRDLTKGVLKKVLVVGAESIVSAGISFGSEAIKTGDVSFHNVAQQSASIFQNVIVGEMTAHKLKQGNTKSSPPTTPQPSATIPAPPPPPPPPVPRPPTTTPKPSGTIPTPIPPPPPPASKNPPVQKKPVTVLEGDERKTHFKKEENKAPLRKLADSKTRITVFKDNNTESSHIIWIEDSTVPSFSGVGKKTETYKYLTSKKGTPEHEVFLEGEKLLIEAFSDSKNSLPKKYKTTNSFSITLKGENTGASYDSLGLQLNSLATDELFKSISEAKRTGDYSKVKARVDWIKSVFAHENTHVLRGNLDNKAKLHTNEVPSHAVQLLSIWGNDSINGRHFSPHEDSISKGSSSTYDRAAVGGLKFLKDRFSKNPDCTYKPKDHSPKELKKAIQSIPENKRESTIHGLMDELIESSPEKFEAFI